MLVEFFSIAVTDLCIKLFEKGGEDVIWTIEGLFKVNMEVPLFDFSILFGSGVELADQGLLPRQYALQ